MSESSTPKSLWEAISSHIVWGALVFTCFLIFIEKVLDKDYGTALAAILLGLGIAAVAYHSKTWLERTNPNWAYAAALALVLALILSPFVEEKRWPFSAWFPTSGSQLTADEIASAVVKALPKHQQDKAALIQPSDAITLCSDGPCIPVGLKPGPEYLRGIGLGTGGTEPLTLNGTATVTTDRLRVAIDYSEYRSGWMEKARVFIGEIKEPIKGQTEHLQLIYYQKDRPNAGQNKLWWGEPTKEHPVTASMFDGAPLPAILIRARLAIIGANGEQHYYFLLVRSAENIGTQVGVISQHEAGDWIGKWESE